MEDNQFKECPDCGATAQKNFVTKVFECVPCGWKGGKKGRKKVGRGRPKGSTNKKVNQSSVAIDKDFNVFIQQAKSLIKTSKYDTVAIIVCKKK